MALFKKHKTEPVPPEDTGAHDTSVGTAADVEAVMKKTTGSPTPGSGRVCRSW